MENDLLVGIAVVLACLLVIVGGHDIMDDVPVDRSVELSVANGAVDACSAELTKAKALVADQGANLANRDAIIAELEAKTCEAPVTDAGEPICDCVTLDDFDCVAEEKWKLDARDLAVAHLETEDADDKEDLVDSIVDVLEGMGYDIDDREDDLVSFRLDVSPLEDLEFDLNDQEENDLDEMEGTVTGVIKVKFYADADRDNLETEYLNIEFVLDEGEVESVSVEE